MGFNNPGISFCIHTGSSMNPLLQNFDLLEIEPYKNRQICTGDIICFQIPGKQENIVHRIIKITSKGIYTRGDNSMEEDSWRLAPNNIYGCVTSLSRAGKYKRIARGHRGKLEGLILRRYCNLVYIISKILSRFYHLLSESGIFMQLIPCNMHPKIVGFQAQETKLIHIMMGKKIIGRYDAILKKWIIKRPFRLFVNEKVLPGIHDKL